MFVAFSPDSTRLVTIGRRSGNPNIRLWDTATAVPDGVPLEHEQAHFFTCAALSSDNRSAVAAFARKDGGYALAIWDATNGAPMNVPDMIQEGYPAAIGFSQDGSAVLSWSNDRTVGLWNAATGARLVPRLPSACWVAGSGDSCVDEARDMSAHPYALQMRSFLATAVRTDQGLGNGDGGYSPDCTRIVGPGKDTYAYLWDVMSGKKLTSDFRHDDDVRTAYFSPSGRRVVTASEDGTARIWDSVSGECLVPPLGHQKGVKSASFSPDESRVVTACEDGFARVWSVETGMRSGPALRHPSICDALFSPDSKLVVTCGSAWDEPETAQIWDAATGRAIGVLIDLAQ